MTAFRITQRSIAQRTTDNLQYSLRRMATTQGQLSSGRLLQRASDNPVGAVSALRYRTEIRQTEQYARNAQDGLGWLGTIDQTLTNALDYTRRARDLSVQAVNGATGPDSKRALAMEIYALRDSLIGLANTEHLGRPVFGGTAADIKPYAADGTFQIPEPAASGIVERAIAPNERVKVNVNGPAVFGADPNNLFNVLTDLADDLMAGDVSNMAGHLNALDARTGNIIDALGEVGARYNRVETMKQRADDQAVTLRGSLSEVEDIDLPATIMDMQLQETAYKAALSATARVLQPSLVDFLR